VLGVCSIFDAMIEKEDVCLVEFVIDIGGLKILKHHQLLSCMATFQILKAWIMLLQQIMLRLKLCNVSLYK
jgi:hypothetical protein